jgi:hypothetical protein
MKFRLAFLLVMLAVTGLLHGQWTNRWSEPGDVAGAANALPRVPLVVGDWDGRDITREESEVVYRTNSPQIVRRYVNRVTGSAVGFLLTCGSPGSMIIEHTPRTCYSELGYQEIVEGRRLKIAVKGEMCDFFSHTFVKSNPAATTRIRLFWSWGDGRSWSFPDRPRIEFARIPVLYKIYVTRDLLSEEEPLTDDPIVSFLETMLPQVNVALFHTQ